MYLAYVNKNTFIIFTSNLLNAGKTHTFHTFNIKEDDVIDIIAPRSEKSSVFHQILSSIDGKKFPIFDLLTDLNIGNEPMHIFWNNKMVGAFRSDNEVQSSNDISDIFILIDGKKQVSDNKGYLELDEDEIETFSVRKVNNYSSLIKYYANK